MGRPAGFRIKNMALLAFQTAETHLRLLDALLSLRQPFVFSNCPVFASKGNTRQLSGTLMLKSSRCGWR